MKKPLIGIAGNSLIDLNVTNGLPVTYTPQGFVDGIVAAEGAPIVLPISLPEEAADYIERIDGLLLAGGQDVSPLLYGEEPSLKLGATSPTRDAFEMALIKEAVAQHKPILAVCRGFQLLNVAYGGTLYQDLSHYPDLTVQHIQQTYFDLGTHTIDIEPDSRLGTIFGKTYLVNSYHHQAVKELARAFKPVAWSKDLLIEGFEAVDSKQSIVAVQWHPELMMKRDSKMQDLFNEFVERVNSKEQDKSTGA
ncbi:gamma-glutamyl-gamma-aminobutyrate hydrolase family protein [Carnobacterium mobile]|uniref:gamma-glutamyl-gamma-aminobutyrate hydrolase family protein n=1 Tax=Carnobacterium mobile TaxID=2750 RepID=UPI000558C778|nr:gamma-glutamyl-gamma-aminobutyrate hydrolase family protein [Carnobacterium mobile]